jgi:hypothetical protein
MDMEPPNGPPPYLIHLDRRPHGPPKAFSWWWAKYGSDVHTYVQTSRWHLEELSQDLKKINNEFLTGDHLQRGWTPTIYVARLKRFLLRMESFQKLNRQMDKILAIPFEMQQRDMRNLKKEIELWTLASKSHILISDLFKRLHSAVKSNGVHPDAWAPELDWTIVNSGITDIDEFLHETAAIKVN